MAWEIVRPVWDFWILVEDFEGVVWDFGRRVAGFGVLVVDFEKLLRGFYWESTENYERV